MAPKKAPELESKPRSCWDVYSTARHRNAMDTLADDYLAFLTACKTERETVRYAAALAARNGFVEDLSGKAGFRVMRGKTILLARRGKRPLSEGFRLVGAHCDTPRIDLKQHPLFEEVQVGLAKTHYYGGIRKHQWLARPLALHGVIALKNGKVVEIALGEDPKDPVFTIGDLLPHLAQKQAEQKLSEAFDAEKLSIVMGHEPAPAEKKDEENGKGRVKKRLLSLLHQRYGIVEDDFYSAELQAVPAGPARSVGLDSSILGGYGHDDRICCYAALSALMAAKTPEHAQIVILWDKEEIGSDGSTGAKSRFFEYCLEDLVDAWQPKAKARNVLMAGKALSSDVHAAIDPDYQDVHERLNASLFGYGPTFCKFTGHRGKYMANDAHAEYVAWMRKVLDDAGVPWQMAELGRVDQGGGGTVAKHLAEYGMDIIDFGPPILSMHSPFELASKADLYATKLAFEAFLKS